MVAKLDRHDASLSQCLIGKGVMLATTNDYLAKRDAETWSVQSSLGLDLIWHSLLSKTMMSRELTFEDKGNL